VGELLGRWRAGGRAVGRVLVVWAVSSATLAVLAGVLPQFRLQAPSGDSPTRIAITAAIGAAAFGLLSALLWPLLVRALLLVPALLLGMLVFFLNGSVLWVAMDLIPNHRGEVTPATAVLIAAVMSAASSATSTTLAMRDDEAYGRRLARLAGRRRRPEPCPAPPGIVFVQLDGVGYGVLREAASSGRRRRPGTPAECGDHHEPGGHRESGDPRQPGDPGEGGRADGDRREGGDRDARARRPVMETVGEWLGTTHRLVPWRTDWSSQTGASQLGILHGSTWDVPAFRWYEKETGQVMVSNRPSSAAELERRAVVRTGEPGLLAGDGASRGNLFTGGAPQLALVMSVAAQPSRFTRSRSGYFAYFSDPANAVRTAASFAAEIGREISQSIRSRMRRERPRVKRGGLYPFLRAFATVVERDVAVAAVVGDMLAGRTAVYADLVGYDEVAHHSGPHSRDATQVLARLDGTLRLVGDAARYAPREYRIVLLSDHGQSPGETFASAYGLTLKKLVRGSCGLFVPLREPRAQGGAEARSAARAALHRPQEVIEVVGTPGSDPVVLASGNLGLISFPDLPGRASREEIDRRHPALLRTLADHPGIGFVLVRSEKCGALVLGADGAEHQLETGRITGADPLAPFGEGAAEAVLRTHRFPHAADIMVNSACDPVTGAVHAFEEQIGSHGGLGGDQSRPFLLYPVELEPGVPDGGLVGAEAVHRLLRDWLECTAELPDRDAVAGDAAARDPSRDDRTRRRRSAAARS
jgi:uncharacterized membrane protein YvlD (DUF360 family)